MIHNAIFPSTCLVRDCTLIFDQGQAPKFIAAQYEWAKECQRHAWGDDPPETPPWGEDEQSGNPLLTALPLHPFEVGHLLAVVDGMGVYAVLRDRIVDEEGVAGPRVFTFAVVAPAALEKGVAISESPKPGEQTCWPVYPVRIRESRLRAEASKAWEYIAKFARARAAEVLTSEEASHV